MNPENYRWMCHRFSIGHRVGWGKAQSNTHRPLFDHNKPCPLFNNNSYNKAVLKARRGSQELCPGTSFPMEPATRTALELNRGTAYCIINLTIKWMLCSSELGCWFPLYVLFVSTSLVFCSPAQPAPHHHKHSLAFPCTTPQHSLPCGIADSTISPISPLWSAPWAHVQSIKDLVSGT